MPPRDAVHISAGAEPTPDGYGATFSSGQPGFDVELTKLHLDVMGSDGALRTRDVPHVAAPPEIRLGPPGPAQVVRVHVSLPRSALRTGMQTVRFRADAGIASRGGAPAPLDVDPSGLEAHVFVPDRAHDAELQRRFGGATVYAYGSLALRCDVGDAVEAVAITRPHTTLRVVSINRVRGAAALLRAGASQFSMSDAAFSYKALEPLEVKFDTALPPALAGMSFSRTGGAAAPPAAPRNGTNELSTRGCRSVSARFADGWDLERALTLGAPGTLPGDVRIGMTHEQVAFVVGFPAVFATRAQLLRMPEWRYDMPAPFASTVSFDGDRVVRYQPPGRLP